MALGTNGVTTAVANNFIPELWSDEVIGAYKSNHEKQSAKKHRFRVKRL